MNVLAPLRRVASRRSTATALRQGDIELSYGELSDQAARFGGFLAARGVRSGDRVGIYPFNYLFHPSALRFAAEDSGTTWIVTPAADVPKLREVLSGLDVADRLVAVGAAADAAITFEDALSAAPPLPRIVPRLDSDDALLMYTSGSTGTPKGVRQTHRNTTAVCEATIDAWHLLPDDHALICTPLFHVGGLQLLALPLLLAGGTMTLRRWDTREWLADAAALRPAVVALVPAMMFDIVNFLGQERVALESIRVCAIGGSALPQSKLKALTEATGPVAVNIYGQTEQSGLAVTEPLDEPRREGSLGKPLEQIVRTRVVLPGGDTLDAASGEVGELWVQGDAVTPGYWQRPETNEQKLTRHGWFRTSDLVYADPDGYLYFVDRTDDMIISGGENIFPQMVEGHLAACPLIAEVAVIGTAHERYGQQVTAIVVPRSPEVTPDDIAAFCASDPNLRGLQRPRRIEIVSSIPRTATNKLDRPALKKAFG